MGEPIEGEYFNWLCAKVLTTQGTIYHDLLKILYETEFTWIIPGDRNRSDDGRELRYSFLYMSGWDSDPNWFHQPCSVLEMLIAFADRALFQTDTALQAWFWEFMTNLDLGEYRQVGRSDVPKIEDILQMFIWRTYDESGHGGMFPLRWPKRDQRKVEIWYQFCDYLEDRGLI